MESMEISKVKIDSSFWKDKKVYLTGHTGFKGSWLSIWLQDMGAIVKGYSLDVNTNDPKTIESSKTSELQFDKMNGTKYIRTTPGRILLNTTISKNLYVES